MNYYGRHTSTINDPGFAPATQWLNGQQVGGMAELASDQPANQNPWNMAAAKHWSDTQRAKGNPTEDDDEALLLQQLRQRFNPPVREPGFMRISGSGQQGPTQPSRVAVNAPGNLGPTQYAQQDNFPSQPEGERFFIGGQDVTNDLAQQSLRSHWSGKPRTVEQLAQERYAQARAAAAKQVTNRLMGNETASLDSITPLLMDPRVQGQDPAAINGLVKGVYGRGLDEYQQAQQLSDAYGQPMTWADIEARELRQKSQAKELALMNAYGSMMGAKGEMGRIVGSTYDPKKKGIAWEEDGEDRLVQMSPEDHDEVKRRFRSLFFGNRSQAQGTPAPQAVAEGPKKLDRETASRLLAKAGGDKNKARLLAREAGYQL
jgi:hypothetical protein